MAPRISSTSTVSPATMVKVSSYGSADQMSPDSRPGPGPSELIGLGHHALLADELAVAELQVGPALEPLRQPGSDQAEHRHRGAGGGQQLNGHGRVQRCGHHADEGTGREHDQDQVEAEHLGHARA